MPDAKSGTKLQVVPQTWKSVDRLKNLEQCISLLHLTMPAIIDSEVNVVNRAYAAWPDRLYAIDIDGRVALKSGPGPMGFRTQDLAAWLKDNIK